jgi:hypothetical protein
MAATTQPEANSKARLMRISLGMGGAVNANLRAHLERAATERWPEAQMKSFKELVNTGKNNHVEKQTKQQTKTQMGSGYVSQVMLHHYVKSNTQQWIEQPLREFADGTVAVGFGQGSISLEVVRHIQTCNEPINQISTQGMGTGAISPAVVRHLSDSSTRDSRFLEMTPLVLGMGTAGISPAVARHLSDSSSRDAKNHEVSPQVFGGGTVSPAVAKHINSKLSSQRQMLKVEIGGGWIIPSIRKHLQKSYY